MPKGVGHGLRLPAPLRRHSLYCGWTTDIERRLLAHRSGSASRYTRSRRPVELAAVIPVSDRSAALREEARIKRLPRSAKLEYVAASRTGARVEATLSRVWRPPR